VVGLPVSISDSQTRNGTATIQLTVEGATTSCGVERWSVKTGTDPDASTVNLFKPTPATIALMRSWVAPNPIPTNSRVDPYEKTVHVMKRRLKSLSQK
jgi:hypothetical protein